MGWKTKEWMCGGFRAVRQDGEQVFVYSSLDWDPSRYAEKPSCYEFRWRGLTAGRLTAENTWRRRLKLLFTLDGGGGINEQDLMEISMQITGAAAVFGKNIRDGI